MSAIRTNPVLFLLILITLGAFTYALFFRAPSAPLDADLLTTTPILRSSMTGSREGDELLALLSTLSRLQIDGSIFSDPRFQGLIDFTVELVPRSIGRANPFAPREGAPAQTDFSLRAQ